MRLDKVPCKLELCGRGHYAATKCAGPAKHREKGHRSRRFGGRRVREDLRKGTQLVAFEAAGGLYQFTRVPFGVTNGVACFQRVIDSFIRDEKLQGTFAYLDDITAAKKWNFVFNPDKSSFSNTKLRFLGYEVENGEIRPDPSRLQPLQDLPMPWDKKSLQRTLGLFAYYSQWIFNYSHKKAFHQLKADVASSAVHAIDESLPFELETDASEVAIAAVLNQLAVEKEVLAVIEAVQHWHHYLADKHFTIKTDQ
uniref:Reverse transcriptase domain-containing protein n=1 Tax=Trichuris muris TaxID=70415 RepID=A0A5S6R0U3_TRIMR